MHVVTCGAPYGAGGMGSHLRQVVGELRAVGRPFRYLCTGPRPGDPAGRRVWPAAGAALSDAVPVRWVPSWRSAAFSLAFDRAAANALPRAAEVTAFAGQALSTLERARAAGRAAVLRLESPTAHVRTVAHQHRLAITRLPIEGPWLGGLLYRRTLAEYAVADICTVPSQYAFGSFVDSGIPPDRLRLRRLSVDIDRFRPVEGERTLATFQVVFVGALTVAKGIGVLLEAFARFTPPDAELVLVGGWSSGGMRRHLQAARQRDPRIRLPGPGDPLAHYQRASVYVHPSYQDGFGLAPLEAAACGLPVVVTRDTGMRDVIADGDSGFVVPSGDAHAISERLWSLYLSSGPRQRMGAAARTAAVQWCTEAAASGEGHGETREGGPVRGTHSGRASGAHRSLR